MSPRRQPHLLVIPIFFLLLFCVSGGKVNSQTLPDHLHGRSALGWSGGGGLLAASSLAGVSRCYCSSKSSVKVLETVWKVQRRRGTLRALKLCVHTPGLLTTLQINPFVPTPEEVSVMTEKKHTNSLLLETLAAFCPRSDLLTPPINRCAVPV